MPDTRTQPYTGDEVSTEAQLAELTRMSNQLRASLDNMIEEQRARVEEFTSSQHSLSALPQAPQVEAFNFTAPQQTAAPAQPAPWAKKQRKPQPPPLATQPRQTEWEQPVPPPLPTGPRRAVPPTQSKDSESSGNYGWMVAVGIFILVIILRNCG